MKSYAPIIINCTNITDHRAHQAVTVHHHLHRAHRAAVVAVIVHRHHQAHPVMIHRPVNRTTQITTVQNAQKMVVANQKQIKRPQSRRSTENDVIHRHRVRTSRRVISKTNILPIIPFNLTYH